MAPRVVKLLLWLACATLPLAGWAQDIAPHLTLIAPPDRADRQVSVVVRAGLASNYGLPEALALARTAMLAGHEISPGDLRALADRRDGLAAQRYVRLLLADPAATASDIAFYGSVAVSTGRVWTLPEAIAAMLQLDPATEPVERSRAYVAMLYPHAWAGNPLALDAVIDLNGKGRLFGALSEETRARIIAQDAVNGDGRAALRMALALLAQQPLDADQSALVRAYLTQAAAGDDLAVSVTATNLLALRGLPAGTPDLTQ